MKVGVIIPSTSSINMEQFREAINSIREKGIDTEVIILDSLPQLSPHTRHDDGIDALIYGKQIAQFIDSKNKEGNTK